MSISILHGDCREVLPTMMGRDSFDCIVTSPPYWGLRDYGSEAQIGQESTLGAYLDTMVNVSRELWRVLKPSGTFWLNIGDCYAGSGKGGGGSYESERKAWREGRVPGEGGKLQGRNRNGAGNVQGLKPKDLCMVPARLGLLLQADGWWIRSKIIWYKSNAMPESVTDRPVSSYEELFLFTKSKRYFYDGEAIFEESSSRIKPRTKHNGESAVSTKIRGYDTRCGTYEFRNARNVWTIPTQAYKGAHFASMPPALAERCIKAGCPIGGNVLDPFGGAGTTGLVADRLGRDVTIIELNPEYIDLLADRIKADAPLFADVHVNG